MSVGQDKKVFSLALHAEGGVVLHDPEIKGCEQIGTTKGTTRMSALHGMYHSENVSSDLT